jgi:hypothetical protein
MDNFTDSSWSESNISCEGITNHWLYFIFSGYLLPLISPKVRRFVTEQINSLRNNEVTGKIVTLTEFGFDKIQDIQKNGEMKNFIRRICIEKKYEYNEEMIDHIAWLFSGDNDETHDSLMQTWTRLNVMLKEPGTIKRP